MKKIQMENRPFGPFPTMIVGAMVDGKPNYTTVGAGGCACLDPVLCISVKNTHHITRGIVQTGCFSVNIPSAALVEKTDYCGLHSGKDVDKSVLFKPFFDPEGNAPMIETCPVSFLCRVCDTKEIRGFTMFFGDIVAAYMDEACFTDNKPDPIKIDPLIMIRQSYCCLKEVVGYPFSEGKKLVL